MFFTTKGESGTGLGLVQVRATVEEHHGRLDLESEFGRGTTFRLTFPRLHRGPIYAQPVADDVHAPAVRGLCSLAVGDDEWLARLAAHMLNPSGHQVSIASSGERAIELLEHELFDLVISDLGLGAGMNGWELADHVRPRHSQSRIILATGWGAAIREQDAAAHGVAAIVSKPYRGRGAPRARGPEGARRACKPPAQREP